MGATGTGGDGGIVRDECVSISLGGGTRIFPQIALAIGVLTSLVFFFFIFFFGPLVPSCPGSGMDWVYGARKVE